MPSPANVSESITAQNTFTPVLEVKAAHRGAGDYVSISIDGRTDSTITLQRRFYNTAGVALSWFDVGSWTADEEAT